MQNMESDGNIKSNQIEFIRNNKVHTNIVDKNKDGTHHTHIHKEYLLLIERAIRR